MAFIHPFSFLKTAISYITFNLLAAGNSSGARESSTGRLWMWGANGTGEVGNNTTSAAAQYITYSPVSVAGGRSWSQVATSSSLTAAIEGSTGNAYCWGLNTGGQIGDNTTASKSSPISVVGGRSFSKIASGATSAGAIEGSTGNAYCWGTNSSGTLGDSTTTSRSSPASVVGGRSFSQISSILNSTSYSAIEGSTGNAYCWGSNGTGKLGDNTATDRSSPVSVVGGRSFSQISTGQISSTAIEGSTGNAYCWGSGNSGRLGTNSTANASSPVSVVGGRSWSKISCGSSYTIAIEGSTGNAYAWGGSPLGNGTAVNASSPTSVLGGRSYIQVAAGNNGSTLLTDGNGVIWGFGDNALGALGNGTAGRLVSPMSIAGGRSFSILGSRCAIEGSTGNAYTWGIGSSGRLGISSTVNASSPTSVFGGRSYSTIADTNQTGSNTYTIEGSTGNAYIWGVNTEGQIGDNTATAKSSPISVAGGRSWSSISGGASTVGVIEGSTGNAYCWGNNNVGQVGDSSIANRSSPISVVGGRSFSKIAALNTVCVALEGSTGNAYSWGNNASNGGLGDGTVTNRSSPVSVIGGRSWSQIGGGGATVVAIEGSTGNAYAWGSGGTGAIGHSSTANASSPTSVFGGRSFSKIWSGGATSIAIEGSTGNAYCWGANTNGNLGDGTLINRSSPTSVLGGRSYVDVRGTSANGAIYALDGNGIIWSWGLNDTGELGNNQVTIMLSPVSITRILS